MINLNNKKNNKGYTIIETMVAVSIFVILVVVGMSTLFNASNVSKKGKDLRNIMDNFNFVVEEMSRNIRDGYNYRCYDGLYPWDGTEAHSPILESPQSCEAGQAIIFENVTGTVGIPTDQWGYKLSKIDSSTTCGDDGSEIKYNICKTTNGGDTWTQLNPPEIHITGPGIFAVLGAEPPNLFPTDYQQPLVTFKLVGEIVYRSFTTPFSLQTTMSQRYLDN